MAERLKALRRMADIGYPGDLTIELNIGAKGWQGAYGGLIDETGAALTRFPGGPKAVLDTRHPGFAFKMNGASRTIKRAKLGTGTQVYDAQTMRALRDVSEQRVAEAIPAARTLYWT